MQKNGKRGGGGDRVLESRHLVMLFLSVVLLCGVFFTLGYVMGHTQYGAAPVQASNGPTHPTPAAPQPKKALVHEPSTPAPTSATKSPCDSSWDNCSGNTPEEKPVVTPAPSKSKPKAEPIPNPKVSGPTTPVPIPGAAVRSPQPVSKNGILLQVAAVKAQRDAIQMADELQKKKFPAFVVDSKADGFYHVQVGPYADKASAESARHALEDAGFKAIIKH